MTVLKYVYYFAIFLALHLVFWVFTGVALWAPFTERVSLREFMLGLVHIFAFAGAGAYLVGRDL